MTSRWSPLTSEAYDVGNDDENDVIIADIAIVKMADTVITHLLTKLETMCAYITRRSVADRDATVGE